MTENKAKLVKKYEKLLKSNTKESELNEADRKLSEDTRESEEGLGIEEEEETGEEPYPEIEDELGHDDSNKDDE